MGFGRFGAHPRGMKSGLYWVSRHLETERRAAVQNNAIANFNERWKRLQDIHKDIMEQFIQPLQGYEISKKEFDDLAGANDKAIELRSFINKNINTCSATELNKYATQLKKMALIAMNACRVNNIYGNLSHISYSKEKKEIIVSDEIFYFLG